MERQRLTRDESRARLAFLGLCWLGMILVVAAFLFRDRAWAPVLLVAGAALILPFRYLAPRLRRSR